MRGNSGSGKSTVARALQTTFERGRCLIVAQDRIRREMLRELDIAGGQNIDLIGVIATWGLDRGMVVIVEGILNAADISACSNDYQSTPALRTSLRGTSNSRKPSDAISSARSETSSRRKRWPNGFTVGSRWTSSPNPDWTQLPP